MSPLFSDQLIKVVTWEQKMKSRHTGFTLIELVITIALLGILLAWAIPNVRTFIKNARISSAASELMGDIGVARQEAQRRGVVVEICASADGTNCSGGTPDWLNGWIIRTVTSGQVIRYNKEPEGPSSGRAVGTTNQLTANGPPVIAFIPSGSMSTTVGSPPPVTINIRDERAVAGGDTTQRDISVTLVGRPQILKVSGP
jgi:prepilin-type N-terminal cleavage/methylation domain-containing protein